MKKLLPVLAACVAATVTAIILSSGAAYAQLAHQAQVQRNNSVEIFKIHASVNATMESAMHDPVVPPFVFVPPFKAR